jgi:uncharacterized delta-60 repeat protein
MIGRYLVQGDIDTTFGSNGYVTLDGSDQLPNCLSGIYSIVVDSQDRIYIPYLQNDNTVWIIRLLADGTPDASWLSSFYGAMSLVGNSFTVGTLTVTSATVGNYVAATDIPSYSGAAYFNVGSGSPVYSGIFNFIDSRHGSFSSDTSFITNRVAVPYLNNATANQIRMALDVNNNLIIAAQVGTTIQVTGIQASDGSAAPLDSFTSLVITPNQLNLYSLITTQDNSIVLAGSNESTGSNIVIKLIGSNIFPGAGQLDTSFNQTGYNVYKSNELSTAGAINHICLAPDGRIYGANYQTITSFNHPYVSRLYNTLYDAQVAQEPSTQEQGIMDFSFGDNGRQTYRGIVNPYCGSYRGNLQQKAKAILELHENFGAQGDLLVGSDGLLNNLTKSNMILSFITPEGLYDGNFGVPYSGQLPLENVTISNESLSSIAQSADGSLYVAGISSIGSGTGIVRKYNAESTSAWTFGWFVWHQSFTGLAQYVALQGTGRVLVFGFSSIGHGIIVGYDQATGHIANGANGASVFGFDGDGIISYNSYGLSMGQIYSAVVNDAGDIFVAYQNSDTGMVNVVGFLPDGSQLITQFGSNGVVSDLFDTSRPSTVRIAKANTGNLLVSACDNNHIYLARLDGVTGQLDQTCNESGIVTIMLSDPAIYQLQGLSDGSILITGSFENNELVFILRITENGQLDTTFNSQGTLPGYEFINVTGVDTVSTATSLAIQSNSGNIVTAGYQQFSDTDASPFVLRSFGQPGTISILERLIHH